MNLWSGIRRTFQTKTAKRIKNKALAGVELVGAGAALTGGAMLLEEAAKPKLPQGHDNVYTTDNGPTLFKYETLASEEEGISTSEIIGYAILAICVVIFSIMFVRAILKIRQMCNHKPRNKDFDDSEDTIFKGNQEPSLPSVDRTIEDTNQHSDYTLDEAVKKAKENYETLSAIRQNTIPS